MSRGLVVGLIAGALVLTLVGTLVWPGLPDAESGPDFDRVEVEMARPDLPHVANEPLTVRFGFREERFEPGQEATASVDGVDEASALLYAEDDEGRVQGLGLLPKDDDLLGDSGVVQIDTKTTAFSLVLLNPPLLNAEPEMIAFLGGLIGDLDAFDDLVETVEAEADTGAPDFLESPSSEIVAAVADVIDALDARLGRAVDTAGSTDGAGAVELVARAPSSGGLADSGRLAAEDTFWDWIADSDLEDLGECGALRAAPGEDRDGVCWRDATHDGDVWELSGSNVTPRWGLVYDAGADSVSPRAAIPGRTATLPTLGRLVVDASKAYMLGMVDESWNTLARASDALPADFELEKRPGVVERMLDELTAMLAEEDFDLAVDGGSDGMRLAIHGFGGDPGLLLRGEPPSLSREASMLLTTLDSAVMPIVALLVDVPEDSVKEQLTHPDTLHRLVREGGQLATEAYQRVRPDGGFELDVEVLWDLVVDLAEFVVTELADFFMELIRDDLGEATVEVAESAIATKLDLLINATGYGAIINGSIELTNVGLNVFFLAAAWDHLDDSAYYAVGGAGGDVGARPDLVRLDGEPNDPDYRLSIPQGRSTQWALRSLGPTTAWSVPETREPAPDVRLLVLDTGIAAHEDLSRGDAVADGVDPDIGAHPEQPGHGTRVAGVASATTDNALGLASPAWDQQVDSHNVFYGEERLIGGLRTALDMAGVSYDATTGEVDVDDDGARVVVNISVTRGTEFDQLESELLQAGAQSGRVLWVASAGNAGDDGSDQLVFPAAHPATVAVGASDHNDEISSFSRRGAELDVLAPGEAVRTVDPEDGYREVDGTSFATPFVSGAAVALWKAEPELTAEQLRKRLLAAGSEERSPERGHGVVDLRRLMTVDTTPPSIEITQLNRTGELAFGLEVTDDTEPLGLDVLTGPSAPATGLGPIASRLWGRSSDIPTAGIRDLRWAIDDGLWHRVELDDEGPQPYRRDDGSLCQVCKEVVVPTEQLGPTGTHHLRVRAWDSSLHPDGADGFAEAAVTLDGPVDATIDELDLDEDSAVAIVLDVSSSMDEGLDDGTRLEAARVAAAEVLDATEAAAALDGDAEVTLITFASSADVETSLTGDVERVADDLAATHTGGATNVGDGLELALEQLAGADASRSIIMLSDGETNRGLDAQAIIDGPAQTASEQGIDVHTVFLGPDDGSGAVLMNSLASATGGLTATAGTSAELQEEFIRADHERGGVMLTDEVTDEADVALPRGFASLRVTALTLDGEPASIDVIAPSGLETSGEAQRRDRGASAVGSLTVPDPEAGDWRIETDRPVTLITSARPSREAVERVDQVRADPQPPAPRTAPADGEVEDGFDPAASPAGVLGLGLVGAGLASVVAGALLVPLAARRPRRGWHCSACGADQPARSRACRNCRLVRHGRAAIDVREGPEAGRRLFVAPAETIGGAAEADHRLADPVLAHRSLTLRWDGERWRLDPAAAPAANGDALTLPEGAPVTAGLHRLSLTGTVDERGRWR